MRRKHFRSGSSASASSRVLRTNLPSYHIGDEHEGNPIQKFTRARLPPTQALRSSVPNSADQFASAGNFVGSLANPRR
jgi:hypothetical protein